LFLKTEAQVKVASTRCSEQPFFKNIAHFLNQLIMKKVFFSIILSICVNILLAQNLHLERTESQHKPFYTHTQVDVNFVNYPIVNLNTYGIGLNVSLVFRDRWASGLAIDVTDSRSFANLKALPPEANVFEYTQLSWINEYILHPNSKIDFSFPLKLGLGHASFVKNNDFFFARTLFSSENTLSSSHFFVVEPGVNVMVHLRHNIDINVGGSYRLINDTGLLANGLNFANYTVHLGLRLRVASKQ
jgi:hypothetical protein